MKHRGGRTEELENSRKYKKKDINNQNINTELADSARTMTVKSVAIVTITNNWYIDSSAYLL